MPGWLSTLIGAFGGSFVTGVAAAYKFAQSSRKRQRAQESAILALLHDRIWSIYDHCKAKKCATVEDIRNIEYLYLPYHAMGGNGTGTELYERVKNMPDKPSEQEVTA